MKCHEFLKWIRESNWKKTEKRTYTLGLYRTIRYDEGGIKYTVHGVDFVRHSFAYEELELQKYGDIVAVDGTVIPR